MIKYSLLLAIGLFGATAALEAASDRDMYNAAIQRERGVRDAMLAADAPRAALAAVRAVVADYRAIVRRYPASGYSDNALWQAGRLSLDAFLRFGRAREKATAARLLRELVATYPTSKLVQRVPEQLALVEAATPVRSSGANAAAVPDQVAAGSAAPAAPAGAPLATIRDIRRALLPDVVRVIVELDAETPFYQEHLSNPERVFVDFSSTRAAASLVDQTLRFDGDGDLVTKIRIGRHPNNTTRVVVDAAGAASCTVYPLHDPYRLVIDCARPPVASLRGFEPIAASVSTRPAPVPSRAVPVVAALVASGPTTTPPSLEGTAKALRTPPLSLTLTSPPSRNSGGGFSMGRQLGLAVSRIVIDPGHGGHDPGAQGKNLNESDLVLDVALRLEKLLLKKPGTDVILTRRTDRFVSLPERTAIANREGADLFLSIHANANESDKARGIETYFLNFANNLGAAAVAARENAASGHTMGALPDFIRAIALNNKLDESRDLAQQVQRAMVERLRVSNNGVKNLGVKQAPFVVLIGAAMPSVLVEISFLTNPQEAKLLRSGVYRQRIAEALHNAIRKYQTSLMHTKTIAERRTTS